MSTDPTYAPVNFLYIALAVITVAIGIAVIVFQTGATRQALTQRRAMLFGGVLLLLLGGVVLVAQVITLLKS